MKNNLIWKKKRKVKKLFIVVILFLFIGENVLKFIGLGIINFFLDL